MRSAENKAMGWVPHLGVTLLSLLCACTPDTESGGCVQVSNERVTLHCDAVSFLEILEGLARETNFELVMGQVEPRRLSLHITDAKLTDALKLLLEELSFELRYGVDLSDGAHRLHSVAVGEREGFEGPPGRVLRRIRQQRIREHRARFAALPPEEQARLLEARAARKRATRAALTPRLEDPNPEVRREAVGQLDADTEGTQRLVEIVTHDPDPRVRAQAASQLSATDSIAGVLCLIRALGDSDPGVVVAAIDSLTFAGDATVVPELRPLTNHPDRRVRQAAAGAIEFLE